MARVKQARRSVDILRPDKVRNADAQQAPGTALKKRAPSRRVWSLEDEVRILEGLAAFAEEHGKPPERSALCDALEGQPLDKTQYTVTQIYEKVRSLKTRYFNMRAAGRSGEDATAIRMYELSAKIWADGEEPRPAKRKVARSAKPEVARSALLPKVARPAKPEVARSALLPKVDRIPDSEWGALEAEGMRPLYPYLSRTVEEIASEKGGAMLRAAFKSAFELLGDEEACKLEARAKEGRIQAARVAIDGSILTSEVLQALLNYMD